MSSSEGFLHWDFGFTRSWDVRCFASDLHGAARLWDWVTLEDGPQVRAVSGNMSVPLAFRVQPDARDVRFELARSKSTPGALWRMRLEQDAHESHRCSGTLELVRTALPLVVNGPLTLVVPPELLGERSELRMAVKLRQLRSQLCCDRGRGTFGLLETKLFLVDDDEQLKLRLHCSDRTCIAAHVEGHPGREWLVADEFKRAASGAKLPGARILLLEQPIEVIAAGTPHGTDLSGLAVRMPELLKAWLLYEGIETYREAEIFAKRSNVPLEFNEMIAEESDGFRLSLVNPGDARDWLDQGTRPGARLDVPVDVIGIAKGKAVDPRPATLLRLFEDEESGRFSALVDFKDPSDVPPGQGRLLPREDVGSRSARKRRQEMIERLSTGRFAGERLLQNLLAPSSVASVAFKVETFREDHRGANLNLRQEEAVAKGLKLPDLLLVQGPPGTGKTHVIGELVRALRQRYGRHERAEGSARPFRILVAGAHNEAVQNVYARVSKDAVVRLITADGEQREFAKRASDEAAAQIVARMRAGLRDDVMFFQLEVLEKARDGIALARKVLVDEGLDSARGRLEDLSRSLTASQLNERMVSELARLLSVASAAAAPAAALGPRPLPPAVLALTGVRAPESTESMPSALRQIDETLRALDTWDPEGREPRACAVQDCLLSVRAMLQGCAARGSVARHVPTAYESLRILVAEIAADAHEGEPTPHEAAPASLDGELVHWCGQALALIDASLNGLRQSDAFVLHEWLRELEQSPQAYERIADAHAPIVAATVQKAADAFKGEPEDFFDVVIVDEAARAGIDVLIPMTLGRHVILVGDHRQLPPHVEQQLWERIDAGVQTRVDPRSSLFDWLRQRLPAENFVALDTQFRMHEDIGRLVSKAFYEPEVTLRHIYEGERAAARRLQLGLFEDQPVVWVDTSDRPDRRTISCNEENAYEARAIRRLLERIPKERLDLLTEERKSGACVAVLPFYSLQAKLLHEELQALPSWLRERLEIATVASVQGREFPLVVVAITKSSARGGVGFLKDANSANVAISRAQSQLIVFGDVSTLAPDRKDRGSPPWRRVIELLRSREVPGKVAMAREVLE